jgi:phosphatidylcholine synthase
MASTLESTRPIESRPAREMPLPMRRALAWGVHLYTGMGLVCAAGMTVGIVAGTPRGFRDAFLLMIVATIIDATDGTLARMVGVKEVLPGFDGRRLDDITDFLTYTCLPLFLIWRAGLLPAGQEGWLLVPLLASAYGFCQADIKTADGYFLGFPSLWNVVAFYLYMLRLDGWIAVILLVTLALLTFVPSRYLYPSQRGRLNRFSSVLGAAWVGMLVPVAAWMPVPPSGGSWVERLAWASLFYPVYYMVASWVVTMRHWIRL